MVCKYLSLVVVLEFGATSHKRYKYSLLMHGINVESFAQFFLCLHDHKLYVLQTHCGNSWFISLVRNEIKDYQFSVREKLDSFHYLSFHL